MAERRASLMEPRIETLMSEGRLEVHAGHARRHAGPRDQRLLQPARRGPRPDRPAAGHVGVAQAAVDRARGDRGRQDRVRAHRAERRSGRRRRRGASRSSTPTDAAA